MLEEIMLDGTIRNKVDIAIERLRAFEPENGYYVAFSGGKDSVCILELCKMAGVKFEAHYSVTSVDPPELVQFIKDKYPEVSRDVPLDKDGKPITMWNLIPKKKMPPTRLARYCCEVLKESAGKGRVTVTGVRWAESARRAESAGTVKVIGKVDEIPANAMVNKQGGIILNDDNDEARRFVEHCYRTSKTRVNPIVDWEDEDVWEFIHAYNVPYCELYDEGFKRLGCIGCPMNSHQNEEFEMYPKYKEAYLRAFDRMLKELPDTVQWKTAEDVMDWWLGKKPKDCNIEGQERFWEESND